MRGEVFVDGLPRRGIEHPDPAPMIPPDEPVPANTQAIQSVQVFGERPDIPPGKPEDDRSLHRRVENARSFLGQLADHDDQQDHHQYADHRPDPHSSAHQPLIHPFV